MKNKLTAKCWLVLAIILLVAPDAAAQKRKPGASRKRQAASGLVKVSGNDALKLTGDSRSVPEGFDGHNAVTLFRNLKYYLSQKNAPKDAAGRAKFLAGKPLLGSLTTDDLFAFRLDSDDSVYGVNRQNEQAVYRGYLYRLRAGDELPEPRRQFVGNCGHGVGNGRGGTTPRVTSRNELVTRFDPEASADELWKNLFFDLATVLPAARRRDYKGYNVGDKCEEFFVPSPQIHYTLAFSTAQPFNLVETEEDYIFSLDTYDFTTARGAGVAAWIHDNEIVPPKWYENRPQELFVFKLAPPYIGATEMTKIDSVEQKPHRAVINKIFVDIAGIWIYKSESREIVRRETGEKP